MIGKIRQSTPGRKGVVERLRAACPSIWVAFAHATLLDLPYMVDSALRHTDFRRNCLWGPPNGSSSKSDKRQRAQGGFLLCAVIVFMLYGATPDALCSVFVPPWPTNGPFLVCVIWVVFAFVTTAMLIWYGWASIEKRKKRVERDEKLKKQVKTVEPVEQDKPVEPVFSVCRKISLCLWLLVIVAIWVVAVWAVGDILWYTLSDPATCEGAVFRSESAWQLGATVFICAASLITLRKAPGKGIWIYAGSLLLASIVLWGPLADGGAKEALNQPFFTNLSLIAPALLVLALHISRLAKPLLKKRLTPKSGPDFADIINQTELFQERPNPELNGPRVIYAIFAPFLKYPVFLALLPSIAIIIAPIGQVTAWSWWALGLSWLFVCQGCLCDRWNETLILIRRLFLTGVPLILSILVIALASLRLSGVQYVSIVLDAAPYGAITMYIASTYILLWLFELAINRPLSEEVLRILTPREEVSQSLSDSQGTRFKYQLDKRFVLKDVTVKSTPRYLQLHGTGRFAVTGIQDKEDSGPAFHTYNRADLFARIISLGRIAESQPGSADNTAVGEKRKNEEATKQLRARQAAWGDLQRRIRAYFFLANISVVLLAAAVAGVVAMVRSDFGQRPLINIEAAATESDAGFDLRSRLIDKATAGEPAIFLAASGGGTRAALYTASVLRGLADIGAARNIVMLSGVSGGSAAVAYFAANRDNLVTKADGSGNSTAWDEYVERVTYPYIEDVIEGAAEVRANVWESYSVLLEESVQRNLGIEKNTTFEEIKDVGLILNSTVAGHPARDSALATALLQLPSDANRVQNVASRGGRLVLGNLNSRHRLPGGGDYRELAVSDATRFHMLLPHTREILLTQGVTVSANFPAVFPNIRVQLYDESLDPPQGIYSVTDGGVLENRGIVSLLYFLRGALDGLKADQIPEIHIVIADASSMSFDYAADRGLGAAFSAGTRTQLADGLIRELLDSICNDLPDESEGHVKNVAKSEARSEKNIGCGEGLQVHILNMPTVFRSRNGFGTHWMMPREVHLTDPRASSKGDAETKTFSCNDVVDTILTIHTLPADYCANTPTDSTRSGPLMLWICGPDEESRDPHWQSWKLLVDSLTDDTDTLVSKWPIRQQGWRYCGWRELDLASDHVN